MGKWNLFNDYLDKITTNVIRIIIGAGLGFKLSDIKWEI